MGEPAIATFAFVNNKLELISLQLSEDKSRYDEYKNIFTNTYGGETRENISVPASLWEDVDYKTILVWQEQFRAFYVIYKKANSAGSKAPYG